MKDFITLTTGRKVRVEWNMNALADYTSATGRELADLTTTHVNIRELRMIAHCAAVEGEKADGRELGLNEEEFGRLMGMNAVVEFAKILKTQLMGSQSPAEKKRPAFLHLRKRG